MGGHPAATRTAEPADANAYRRDLFISHPDSRQPAFQPALDSEISQGADDYLLEIADVIHDTKARRPHVDNRISDELAGAMECYVASPIGDDKRRTEPIGRVAKVRFGGSLSGSEHGRVLEK